MKRKKEEEDFRSMWVVWALTRVECHVIVVVVVHEGNVCLSQDVEGERETEK